MCCFRQPGRAVAERCLSRSSSRSRVGSRGHDGSTITACVQDTVDAACPASAASYRPCRHHSPVREIPPDRLHRQLDFRPAGPVRPGHPAEEVEQVLRRLPLRRQVFHRLLRRHGAFLPFLHRADSARTGRLVNAGPARCRAAGQRAGLGTSTRPASPNGLNAGWRLPLAGEAMLAIAGAQALRPGEPATQALRPGALHQVARGVPRKGEKNPVVAHAQDTQRRSALTPASGLKAGGAGLVATRLPTCQIDPASDGRIEERDRLAREPTWRS